MTSQRASVSRVRNVLTALLLGVFTIAISFVLHIGGAGVLPPEDLRTLARTIVENAYNPRNETLTSYSPNAVSAIIWDYRGIDTILETAVLFAAVTGVTLLLRKELKEDLGRRLPVSVVLSTSVKIVALLTCLVAASVAVHGHLTPGGGFQAGAIIAATTALFAAVYSVDHLRAVGLRSEILLKIRVTSLTLILILMLFPLVAMLSTGEYAYIMQNQVKEDSRFAMPFKLLNTPLAGTIFFFNIIETVAVAAALSYVVIAIAGVKE